MLYVVPYSVTVISIEGINFQMWWVSFDKLTEAGIGESADGAFWFVLHWMSTLKRPGVKNRTENWCDARSSLLNDGIIELNDKGIK